ncbi:hypothetical protein CVT24_011351 [Panaeolus cyanescens]|uniref:Uncharacterized protein n=1 Tax=Panaeolus cyanescens TaxID=181874 RepID=A0A409YGI3_9AGAR|nr:hypothetical protein CVT24_011351 [Panaeolus cyanescens]
MPSDTENTTENVTHENSDDEDEYEVPKPRFPMSLEFDSETVPGFGCVAGIRLPLAVWWDMVSAETGWGQRQRSRFNEILLLKAIKKQKYVSYIYTETHTRS